MKLIVGLGNIGKKYEKTRHNVGFFILDRLAEVWDVEISRKKFKGFYGEASGPGDEKIILLEPQTMMNLSGECVAPWAKFLKLDGHEVLVVHDDLDLPLGRLRGQWAGGAGGHNGVTSIIESLGHRDFSRLRVGIGHPGRASEVVSFVLNPFLPEEREEVEAAVERGVEGIQVFVEKGLDPMMQLVNTKQQLKPLGPAG